MLKLLVKTQFTPSMPGIIEVNRCLSMAMATPGKQFDLNWYSQDRKTTFTLVAVGQRHSATCSLVRTVGNVRELLWTKETADFLFIHSLMSDSQNLPFSFANLPSSNVLTENADFPVDTMESAETGIRINFGRPENRENIEIFPMRTTLKECPVSELLRLAAANNIDGRLSLRDVEREGFIYFLGGTPTNAKSPDCSGDEAIVEMVAWETGNARFRPGAISKAANVYDSGEKLAERGSLFAVQNAYLRAIGMTPNASVVKPSRDDFAEKLEQIAADAELNLDLLTRFYEGVDNRSLRSLATELFLENSEFVKIVYHLLAEDLLILEQSNDKWNLAEKSLDRQAINGISSALSDPDTGLLTHAAFLYFLQFEYFRSFRAKLSLSVILIEIAKPNSLDGENSITREQTANALNCISSLKRKVDILAHYEAGKFALLLPSTSAIGAQLFAKKLQNALKKEMSEESDDSINVYFGASSIPEDCVEPGRLLSGAEFALRQAIDSDEPFVLFKDVRPS